jgi:hypothetical protein
MNSVDTTGPIVDSPARRRKPDETPLGFVRVMRVP